MLSYRAPSRLVLAFRGSRVRTPSTLNVYPQSSGAKGPTVADQMPLTSLARGTPVPPSQSPLSRTSKASGAWSRK